MNVWKNSAIVLTILGLNGCLSGTSNYYILSVPSQPEVHYNTHKKIIAVEKVTVPGYLYKRDIAVAQSNSQITLLDNALWGEDLDSGLSNRLITYFQKKFNHPDVYLYPWGIDTQPDIKVSVQVTRFIAKGEYVYLDATWSVEELKTKRRKAKLFSTRVATQGDIKSIVSSMDKAFSQLEEVVAQGLR